MNEDGSTRIRLDIAYDGTSFAGWAKQPALRTVQGTLENALATIFRRHGEPPTLTVAGRTDSGVHATGQVAHLDLSAEQLAGLTGDLGRRINGVLGLESDVVVTAAGIAPAGFDARFSAVWRRYEYRVADATVTKNPVLRGHVVSVPGQLDLAAMDEAALALVGLHDWAAYCKPREGATTVRFLQDFRWSRESTGVLVAEVKADAFCHSMVRSLVGATVAVGSGKLATSDLTRLRDAAQRTSEYKVMPAKGLTLVQVGYPADIELGARALQTRARREPVVPNLPNGLM
ncbi:tRNA pseudouridine(38-40) synthase TruA [soil metagenome]